MYARPFLSKLQVEGQPNTMFNTDIYGDTFIGVYLKQKDKK